MDYKVITRCEGVGDMETKYKTHHIFEAVLLVIVLAGLTAGNLRAEEKAKKEDSHIAWLKQHAIPLRSIDPNDEDFMDLEPLAKIFENVRIVQLGEQSHGDGAAFHAKTRLVKFLHQELGFDVLAFESGLYDCHKAWELLRGGMDAYEAFSHGVFGIWSGSEQVRPLIDYWGRVSKGPQPLELCGFDCQFSAKASRELLVNDVNALWKKLGSATPDAGQRAAIVKTLTRLGEWQKPSPKERQEWHNSLAAWGKALETASPSDALTKAELAFWRQFVASTSTAAATHKRWREKNQFVRLMNLRDLQMARNLVWLTQSVYPKRKIIVWAASGHLARNSLPNSPSTPSTPMGHQVWNVLGKETYTVAFDSAEGKYKRWFWHKARKVKPLAPGSLEDLFVRAGYTNAFLNFRGLGPDGAWFKQNLTARLAWQHNYAEANWTEMFDGIVFIRKMFGSTPAGDIPLHYAAEKGYKEIVELLIVKGADINAKNADGDTPLNVAVRFGHEDVVKFLIAKGADVSFHEAVRYGDLAAVKKQSEKVSDINEKDASGQTSLHYAVGYGHKDVAELLIAKGTDVNAKNASGQTPLHYAARTGRKDVVELLIANEADINAKNDEGRTPVDVALSRDRNEVVKLLIAKGADVSSIHLAAYLGDVAKVMNFIEQGSDVNAKNQRGLTPLHYAARRGHKEIVEVLLAHGADVDIGGNYNQTAAEFAMGNNHRKIVQLLVSKGADISPLHFALYMKDEAKARSLIEGGADVNRRTPYGTTSLDRAVDAGFKDIVELLIAKGANVNAKDNWGWTPLHSAVSYGSKDMVELLIAKGVDINVRDGDGRMPIRYAKNKGYTKIVELLRKHGAKE
jgi:ankyrin repeat protein/erythromycin esterase-like protein